MLKGLRHFMILSLVFSLGLSGVPVHAQTTPSKRVLDEIKDNFELMVPVRRGENFTELYYRIETRLGGSQKQEIAELNRKLGFPLAKLKSPEITATENSVTFKDGGEPLVIKVEKDKKGELFLTANGHRMSQDIALSPLKSYDFLVKIISDKESKKGAWLWRLLVPDAHAFNWGKLIGGVAAAGMVGYLLWQKFDAMTPACKKRGQTCCKINSVETQLADGCCAEAGGLDTGAAICMPVMYVEPLPSPGPSTGVQ